MKKLLVAAGVAGIALTAAGAAAYGPWNQDTGVTINHEPEKSRADYITLWQQELQEDGKELPPDVEEMSKQQIIHEWTKEFAKDAEPG